MMLMKIDEGRTKAPHVFLLPSKIPKMARALKLRALLAQNEVALVI